MTHTVLVVADHQIPYHDAAAIEAVHKYAKVLRPDEVIINGDFMDFPQLSTKFKRDRSMRYALEDDLALGKGVLKDLRKAVGKRAVITYLEGNHELRLRSFVKEQADALEPLLDSTLTVQHLLELDSMGIGFIPGWDTGSSYWERDGLMVTHGNWHAKTTAAKSHMNYYGSVLFSHVHRPTISGETPYTGTPRLARSTGCLCAVRGHQQPPRAGTTPGSDWVQGFAVIHFGLKRYQVHILDIVDGIVTGLDGKEYYG